MCSRCLRGYHWERYQATLGNHDHTLEICGQTALLLLLEKSKTCNRHTMCRQRARRVHWDESRSCLEQRSSEQPGTNPMYNIRTGTPVVPLWSTTAQRSRETIARLELECTRFGDPDDKVLKGDFFLEN